MKKPNIRLTALLASLLVAGCVTAPPLQTPQIDTPNAYKESGPIDGAWKIAQPADRIERGEWWRVFGDAKLDELVREATQASPTLAAVAARVKQARALAGVVDADRSVQIGVGAGPTRQGVGDAEPQTTWRAQATVAYEVDLFGRLSNASDAAKLDAESQEAAYRSAVLALQADVAQTYFAARSLDNERKLLRETVRLREEALSLVQSRARAGDIGELDVARAKAELANTKAEAIALDRRRAQLEHALALLLGKAPAQFAFAEMPIDINPPLIPAGLPSDLLERRPDIAAAQRQLAAASARIGVAKAAFFPRISLTGAAGYESTELSDLFKWSSRSWVLGPIVGTVLSLPVFDGGRNRANLARSEAQYEETVAGYRQQVLVAFREVEDNLSGLRTLSDQARAQADAVEAARRAAQLSDTRYRNGLVSYFEVIDAQRSSLGAQRAATQVSAERIQATVGLIRALGGGWNMISAVSNVQTPTAKATSGKITYAEMAELYDAHWQGRGW